MKTRAISSEDDSLLLESDIGQIGGCWRESSVAPSVGQLLSIEFTIDHTVRVDEVVEEGGWAAVARNGWNELRGQLEAIDDDGVGYLRLAPDCLVLVETDGGVTAGQWIQLRIPWTSVGVYGESIE